MSAKDAPVARKALSLEQLKAFVKQLQRDEPAPPLCDCGPNDRCPVCTAGRGQSVFVREPNDEGE